MKNSEKHKNHGSNLYIFFISSVILIIYIFLSRSAPQPFSLKVGTVSKYEQGDRTSGIGKLQLIANALVCGASRFVASGDEYVRMTQTTDYGNNLDAYLYWLKFSHFGCNSCQIENDDRSKSSSYLISFD